MLTLTGNGRLTRDVELRSTRSGDSGATVSVASDRRDRQAGPVYVDLILWRGQAEAAADTWSRARRSRSPDALSRATTRPAMAARASPTSSTTLRSSTGPSPAATSSRLRRPQRRGGTDADDIPF